ncbi:flavin reductase family protein [Hansschlegelia sp.]|uniref:flavin reductase family protein n=1 Tax=Hansschlegelia sp. TaxID=2041892 RepID=UPI002C9B9532|nr:flavin reductase family protein [Hansschlegelia sp.]HVI28266.1 flavin reductase family protein [Hansschlegelia sp.]
MSAAAALNGAAPTGVSPAAFRATMRRHAAGVVVITSSSGGVANGMTATAVASVTADPPTVLIVVNRGSQSYGLIRHGGAFALNFLAESQQNIASYFAGSEPKSFQAVPHRSGVRGCPLLEGCAAHLECLVEDRHEVGSHAIFIGRVVAAGAGDAAPLAYFEAGFHGLKAL